MAESEYRMPSLGADMKDGRVLEWFVTPGQSVHRGEVVGVVDTDKGAIEIEIWEDAVIDEIVVEPGTKVPVGELLMRLRAPSEVAPAPAGGAAEVHPGPSPPERAASPAARRRARALGVDLKDVSGSGPGGAVVLSDVEALAAAERVASSRPGVGEEGAPPAHRRATPVARRAAEVLGVDLSVLSGTGTGGTITRDDVLEAAGAPPGQIPELARAPSPAGDARRGEVVEAGPAVAAPPAAAAMRSAIAAAMTRSKREIPHYYLGTTVSARAAMAWLADVNAARPPAGRLLAVSLFVKAIATCLRDFPELNGHWTDGRFQPSERINPGLAVALRGGGLVAPALLDADRASVEELSAAVSDVVNRARGGRLRGSEVTDATITVSSMGDRGVDTLYGVIHPPQVALVGVGRIVERPWAEDGMLGVHPIVHLTLSGDHRASDGHRGGLFLHAVGELLQHPETL